MKRLHRIDQNSCNLLRPPANKVKRGWVYVLERQAIADTAITAQPRLYPVPPAVIRSRKTHDQLLTGIKPCQTYRSHDGFGATHMKGHFVHSCNGFKQCDIFGHDWVERSQNRTKVLHPLPALLYPLLVAVKSRHVESIRATHI